MKKALVALMALILFAFAGVGALAGPTLTVRSWDGAYIPSVGVQYDGMVTPWIELYKSDFYNFAWAGDYWLEGGLGVEFGFGNVDMKLPFGVAVPITVSTSPLSFQANSIYGVVGVWIDGGYGAAIRLENYFDGNDLWWSLGFQVDLHGLWLILNPVPVGGGGDS